MSWLKLVLVGVVLLCLAGCSGAGQSANGIIGPTTLRSTLSTSSKAHIIDTIQEALVVRYGYRLERQEVATEDVRMETSWKISVPTTEELAAGFTDIRIRIIVTARPRNRASGGTGTSFTPRFTAELGGAIAGSDVWTDTPFTPERESEVRQIISYLNNEFKAGVR